MTNRFSKILIPVFLFSLLVPIISFGQNSKKADSLKALLKIEQSDTNIANIYNRLANLYRFIDPLLHREYSLKAISISRKANFSPGLASGYNLYGQVFENEGQYQTALLYYDSSLTRWKQLNNEEQEAKMDLNIANVYNRIADYPSATDYTIRSLKLQEKLKNKFGLAVCNLTLGNIYFQQNDIPGAIKAYETGFKLNRESSNNPELEASLLGNIGAMFEQMNKYDSALHYFRIAIETFSKNGMTTRVASYYNNMGSCFKQLKDYDSSMYYSRLGLAINLKLNHPEGAASSFLSLGNTELAFGNPDSALVNFQHGLLIAKQIGTRDLESEFYYALSKNYEKKKQFETSLDYLHKYINLNDSLHGEKQTMAIEQMKKSYEMDKKNQAMLIAATQTKLAEEANRRNAILFVSGGILLLLVIVVIFFMLRNKQKHNSVLEKKNDEISLQKEEITASITYARRIQQSVMPDERILKKSKLDYFILNKPRDIVSGDFYWLAEKEGRTYIAVADCTGHGVPGALVSVIGINMLNKIIEQPGKPSSSEILEFLHVLVINALNKDAEVRDTSDGMDIGLLCIDATSKKAFFSGAGRPLYYTDNAGFHLIKGDRYSVAGEKKEGDAPFSEFEISITDKTTFYLSSDGYVDQFGEATGKKFLSKKFHELLAIVSSLPMNEQAERIEKEFLNWKGSLEQVDDVMVLGVRI